MIRAVKLTIISISILLSGFFFGYLFHKQTQPPAHKQIKTTTLSSSTSSLEIKMPLSAPKQLIRQIETDDFKCLDGDPISYESCLLYQSALFTWMSAGMPRNCPARNTINIVEPVFSEQIESTEIQHTSNFEKQLVPPINRITIDQISKAQESPCFQFVYAINVATTVPMLVSTGVYGFRKAVEADFQAPGSNASLCLQLRQGICGNHVATGMALLKNANINARSVEFYYTQDGIRMSHIAIEVYINNKWRLIDTTFGAYWEGVETRNEFGLASTESIMDRLGSNPIFNSASNPFSFFSAVSKQDYFAYLDKSTDIVRGGHGTIKISLAEPAGRENFQHRPNYIGDNSSDGVKNSVSFLLDEAKQKTFKIRILVNSFAFSEESPHEICIDSQCKLFSKDVLSYEFKTNDPKRFFLKSSAEVAYLVLDSFEWSVQ